MLTRMRRDPLHQLRNDDRKLGIDRSSPASGARQRARLVVSESVYDDIRSRLVAAVSCEELFGPVGVKHSGTGWCEAGVEALDVYSDWKCVNVIHDPAKA
jgi:hypothetical protein